MTKQVTIQFINQVFSQVAERFGDNKYIEFTVYPLSLVENKLKKIKVDCKFHNYDDFISLYRVEAPELLAIASQLMHLKNFLVVCNDTTTYNVKCSWSDATECLILTDVRCKKN